MFLIATKIRQPKIDRFKSKLNLNVKLIFSLKAEISKPSNDK